MTPLALADSVVGRARDLWKALDIEYDFFIRTTMDFHEKGVQKLFQMLLDKGDIYKGEYKGWYCVSDENFLAEDVPLDAEACKTCPDCGKKASLVSEETYFFRLSAYQDRLLKLYEAHPEFVRPQSRMNEVASFVRGGLKDLSITRTTVKWGIPVPGDPSHTIYVWFDALHNYVTAIGYDWNMERFEKFWPADVHLIGKDILRFHAVYLAGLPHGLGPAPARARSSATAGGSRTTPRCPSPRATSSTRYVLLNAFGPDPLRYFLLREIPIGQDGNFSHEGFLHRVNSDLANDLGNLVQRTLTMIRQLFRRRDRGAGARDRRGPRRSATDFDRAQGPRSASSTTPAPSTGPWRRSGPTSAQVNKYLADNEPWIMAKDAGTAGRGWPGFSAGGRGHPRRRAISSSRSCRGRPRRSGAFSARDRSRRT